MTRTDGLRAPAPGVAATLLLCAAGAVVRVLAAFPSFRHPLQSDSTMTGLTAFEILRGEPQVFLFDGTRLGALESYLHLPVFALLGASRATLHVAPVLAGVALLAVFAALARELLGPEEGRVALLLLAVPSPVVLLWNMLPFGYVEVLFFIAAVLLFAVRISSSGALLGGGSSPLGGGGLEQGGGQEGGGFNYPENVRGHWGHPLLASPFPNHPLPGGGTPRPGSWAGPTPWSVLGFGLAAGLGWWSSALSLAGTLPAALWIVLHRPALLRSRRFLALAATGFVAGALPWIVANVADPLVSFRASAWKGNFAFQTVGGLEQLLHNAGRLALEILPALLLRAEGVRPAALDPLVVVAGVIHLLALVFALAAVAAPQSWRGDDGARRVPPLLLPLLVAGCTSAFFTLSSAGSIPGDVVRYVVPIGLAAPLLLAPLVVRIAAWSRVAAAVVLLALLGVHVSGYDLPWSASRTELRRLAAAEDRLIEQLAEHRIGWVFGPYWDVYGLNFLSGETLRAIPGLAAGDYHSYERKLGPAPVPFALVSREPGEVESLARRAGLSGERIDVDGTFEVFFVADPAPVAPAKQVRLLRRALAPAPLPPEAMRSRIEILEGMEEGAALRLAPGGQRKLRVRLTHAGRGAPWVSTVGRAPQGAVRVGIRWLRGDTVLSDRWAADQRAELPRSLAPGESAEADLFLTARDNQGTPLRPGSYEVRIELVQELVRSFDEAGDATLRVPVEVE